MLGSLAAYVLDNDVYVVDTANLAAAPQRVTSDGSDVILNGVPDWAYEEEVRPCVCMFVWFSSFCVSARV